MVTHHGPYALSLLLWDMKSQICHHRFPFFSEFLEQCGQSLQIQSATGYCLKGKVPSSACVRRTNLNRILSIVYYCKSKVNLLEWSQGFLASSPPWATLLEKSPSLSAQRKSQCAHRHCSWICASNAANLVVRSESSSGQNGWSFAFQRLCGRSRLTPLCQLWSNPQTAAEQETQALQLAQ